MNPRCCSSSNPLLRALGHRDEVRGVLVVRYLLQCAVCGVFGSPSSNPAAAREAWAWDARGRSVEPVGFRVGVARTELSPVELARLLTPRRAAGAGAGDDGEEGWSS